MNYGFVIDTRSCIGCHACSTACKSENQVPLGVNRTWVKVVETGRYPDSRRAFQVSRCNHCSNPPCARICPVTAMYQRDDGIVEFDSDICIGCKACMQACPYDAIYVDPESGTAAKCHYCAHRVEHGLEPACVIVCPTHSIIAGDMDDPSSEITRVLARHDVTVRKPEQGTAPKLFYVAANDVAMRSTALPRQPDGMIFADVLDPHGHHSGTDYDDATRYEVSLRMDGDPISLAPGAQATVAGHMVQVAYNAQHRVPWHWQVPAYLVTKGVGAGAFLLLAIGVVTGWFELTSAAVAGGGFVGLLGLIATTILLVADLERPERFLRIVLRPQLRSWLARGAFILIAFSSLAGLWWALETAAAFGFIRPLGTSRLILAWLTLPLAVGTAVYTAFLFAQCEGRDLWQSPLLPFHLLVQAVTMGGAALALTTLFIDAPGLAAVARWTLLGGLAVDLFVTLLGEHGVSHASEQAARAAHAITHGRYKPWFWGGAVVVGHVLPMALLAATGMSLVIGLAAVLSIIGLYAYEHAYVMAPQEIPNS